MIELYGNKNLDSEAVNQLLAVWESAVVSTHNFLSTEKIGEIKIYVKDAFKEMDFLLCIKCPNDGKICAFTGIKEDKIEMLFVHNNMRGKGLGKVLVKEAIEKYNIKYVDVNEDNTQGVGFYLHLGFEVFDRSPLDEQGNPFPILHMIYKNKA